MWTLLLVETAAETPRPSEVLRKEPQALSWTSGAADTAAVRQRRMIIFIS